MTHKEIAANARKPYADAIRKLQQQHDDLLATLEMMVRAFNVNEIDPLIAFATIEKARATIAKVRS